MSDVLLVGTRKGLFHFERNAQGQWQIQRTAFMGDPVIMVLPDSRSGKQFASLDLGHFGPKLHCSSDHGTTWDEITTPAFPVAEETKEGESEADPTAKDPAESAPSVKKLWVVAPGGADEPDTLWAGAIPAGLFKSIDGGQTWHWIQSLWDRPEREFWFGGGYDDPGIHSILVDPRNSQRVFVAISCGGVWETLNNGKDWSLIGRGLRAAYVPDEQAMELPSQDPHCVVRSTSNPDRMWMQHHNGMFHSRDAGHNWEEFNDVKPANFGFAVAVHPQDENTAWFVPATKDEHRIPVNAKLVVNRTRDGGKTFETLRNGLPQEHAYDLIFRHALDVDNTGSCLAFGSTTGNLWISEDQGDSWALINAHLPPVNCVRFGKS